MMDFDLNTLAIELKDFTVKHLSVDSDISDSALAEALYLLEYSSNRDYYLYITLNSLDFIIRPLNPQIKVNIVNNPLHKDFWYLVCPTTKTAVYSPGA